MPGGRHRCFWPILATNSGGAALGWTLFRILVLFFLILFLSLTRLLRPPFYFSKLSVENLDRSDPNGMRLMSVKRWF